MPTPQFDVGDLEGATLTGGNLDGDGYADVVLGAPEASGQGKAQVGAVVLLRGSAGGLDAARAKVIRETQIYPGVKEADEFGAPVTIGDITGDGHPELVVAAASFPGQGPGAVYVFHGSPTGLVTTNPQRFTQGRAGVPGTEQVGSFFGNGLRIADLVGDAHPDLAVAATEHSVPGKHGFYAGYVDILPGTASGITGEGALGFAGKGYADYFGSTLA